LYGRNRVFAFIWGGWGKCMDWDGIGHPKHDGVKGQSNVARPLLQGKNREKPAKRGREKNERKLHGK